MNPQIPKSISDIAQIIDLKQRSVEIAKTREYWRNQKRHKNIK